MLMIAGAALLILALYYFSSKDGYSGGYNSFASYR